MPSRRSEVASQPPAPRPREPSRSPEEEKLNLRILTLPLAGSRLVEDYLREAGSAADFYPGSPLDPDAYRRKAVAVDARFATGDRQTVRDLVRPATSAAAARLDRVVDGDGFFVTTGQQPGLFTGPLYTIYKFLSAVRWARSLEGLLQRPVEPLFWIASDDHDWDEANHVHVLDRRNRLIRIEVRHDPASPPASLARRRLGGSVESVLGELADALPESEFASDLLTSVRAAYRPELTAAEAFAELLHAWLGRFGLLTVDAAAPAVKLASAAMLEREAASWPEREAELAGVARQLERAGYGTQVPVLEHATSLFYEDEEGRDRLFRDAGGWYLRRSGRRFAGRELMERLRSEPQRFSPNVLLRPVVEATLLPTLGYVGGPAELAYFAQTGPLFAGHGVEGTVAIPRHGAVLLEAKVSKVLEKFDLEVAEFRRPVHEIVAKVAREELPAPVATALAELRAGLGAGYERLSESAAAIDPTLSGPLGSARAESLSRVDGVEKKILRHLKQRNAVALEQIEKAAVNLYPEGRPQERVVNVCSYLARYGPELLDAVADAFEPELRAAAGVDGAGEGARGIPGRGSLPAGESGA